jgi:hypothetical protein
VRARANPQYDQLPAFAADLVRHQVAVIAADTPVAALAAKQATTSIPIVFSLGSDPVRDGLVASLNRPGGNITGATFFSNLLSARRLDLFHRLVPNATVIAVLLNPKNANVELERQQTQGAAHLLGLQPVLLQATNEREIDEAVGSLIQQRAAALIVSGDVTFFGRRQQIAEYRRECPCGGGSKGDDQDHTHRLLPIIALLGALIGATHQVQAREGFPSRPLGSRARSLAPLCNERLNASFGLGRGGPK